MDNLYRQPEEHAEKKTAKRVILLEDLDGDADDVLGGASEKLFFGETPSPLSDFPPLGGAGFGGK